MDNDKKYLTDRSEPSQRFIFHILETKEGEIATLKEKIRTLEQELALYQRKFEFTEPPIMAAEDIRIEELTI